MHEVQVEENACLDPVFINFLFKYMFIPYLMLSIMYIVQEKMYERKSKYPHEIKTRALEKKGFKTNNRNPLSFIVQYSNFILEIQLILMEYK